MNDIPLPASVRPAAAAVSRPGAVTGAPPAPRRSWLSRRGRLLAAVALVGLAGVALLRQQMVISTEHAVISAYTTPMRTPIGGEVTFMAAQPGTDLPAGAVLARVQNGLADQRRLLDARAERDRARDEATALSAQIDALDALAAIMATRAEDHREETARMLAAGLEEGLRLQAAAEAHARRHGQEALRALELARGGITSAALRERAEAERDAALEEAAALVARGDGLRTQARAAARGLFIAGGYGGVGYLEQRLDEIALRRTELVRQLAALEAAVERGRHRTAEEALRLGGEREALVTAPGDWHAWRVLAKPGQRVLPEETLAELIDCHDVFVLAAIPQSDAPGIAPGQPARLRLAGESEERAGIVVGLVPDGMVREVGRLAVLPTRPRGNSQVLRIAIAQPEPGTPCPVGRTGRVLLDRPSSLAVPGLGDRTLSDFGLSSLQLPGFR